MASNGHVLCAGNWTKIDNCQPRGGSASFWFSCSSLDILFPVCRLTFMSSAQRQRPRRVILHVKRFPRGNQGWQKSYPGLRSVLMQNPRKRIKSPLTFMPSSQLELGNNFFCSVCPSHFFDGKALGRGFEERRFATLWYTWYAQEMRRLLRRYLICFCLFQSRIFSGTVLPVCLANRRGARGQHTLMYLARQSSVCSVRLVALKLWENEQLVLQSCIK